MRVKKVLKIIGIIVAIVFILVLIHTIRNYMIITGLQDKINQYSNSSNYYTKSVQTFEEGTVVTMEYYKKDNRQALFLKRDLNGVISKISTYDNGERIDTFFEGKAGKTAQLGGSEMMSDRSIDSLIAMDNKWQTFLASIVTSVKTTNYNGKDCYIIKGFLSSSSIIYQCSEFYIEKDTGLCVKSVEGSIVREREYKFDSVDDSIFTEPDISQYTLQKNR